MRKYLSTKYLDIPPIWTLLALALVALLSRYLPLFDLRSMISNFMIGLPLAIGIFYFFAAAFSFYRHKTTIDPHGEPSTLITGGIYKISRNPIYTADVLFVISYALYHGALSGLLVALGLWIILRQRFVLKEESYLLAHFPEAEDYFAKTNRW